MAKIIPIANVRPTQIRYGGAVTAGTFVKIDTAVDGVVAAAANEEVFGVAAHDGVLGDLGTVWTDGDFEADSSGALGVGDEVDVAAATQVILKSATHPQCGLVIGLNPASGARVRIRLVTKYNGLRNTA
ncbi:MAG: DUF2190 family protein [Chloroflexi bacterium]|nr:DUF2190 family protein [Chloroflexota bacterium]